jgi:hypothetical protein
MQCKLQRVALLYRPADKVYELWSMLAKTCGLQAGSEVCLQVSSSRSAALVCDLTMHLGNGINVIKVMPESAVKFGSYEVCSIVESRNGTYILLIIIRLPNVQSLASKDIRTRGTSLHHHNSLRVEWLA